jgi:hypothetical protein
MCPALQLLKEEQFKSKRLPEKTKQPQQNAVEDVWIPKKGVWLPKKEGLVSVHHVVGRKLQ